MTDTFFPTSSPAINEELQAQVTNLTAQVDRMTTDRDYWLHRHNELQQKIVNVKGHLFDMYSMNSEIDEDMEEIARLLNITLMKEIHGTATLEISWTAQVPLNSHSDDFEISYSIECDSYEAEEFDWNEDNFEIHVEDSF